VGVVGSRAKEGSMFNQQHLLQSRGVRHLARRHRAVTGQK
jgi:hypothetical protein